MRIEESARDVGWIGVFQLRAETGYDVFVFFGMVKVEGDPSEVHNIERARGRVEPFLS